MFVLRNSLFDAVFFVVLSRLRNKRTVFWKKKEKRTHCGQKWVGKRLEMKGYLEIYNRVKYIFAVFFKCDLFHVKLLGRFLGVNSNVTILKTLKIVSPSLSILFLGMTRIGVAKGAIAPPSN